MELKKSNEELRSHRSDPTAQTSAYDHSLFAYMRFLGATVRLAEPLVMRELQAAVSGEDSDRVAWAVKAAPICRAVSETVLAEKSPTPRTELLRKVYGDALRSYAMLADAWIEAEGVHTEDAESSLTSGTARWEHAADDAESVNRRLSRA